MSEMIQEVVEKLIIERNRLELQIQAVQEAIGKIQDAYLVRDSGWPVPAEEEEEEEESIPEDITSRLPTTTTTPSLRRRGRPAKTPKPNDLAALSTLSVPLAIESILRTANAPMRALEIRKALTKAKVKLTRFPQQQISRILNHGAQFKKIGLAWTLRGLV